MNSPTDGDTSSLANLSKEIGIGQHLGSLMKLMPRIRDDYQHELNRIEMRRQLKARDLRWVIERTKKFRHSWLKLPREARRAIYWQLGGHGGEYGPSHTALHSLRDSLIQIDRACNGLAELLGSSSGSYGKNLESPNAPPPVALYPAHQMLREWWNENVGKPRWNPQFVGEENKPLEADNDQARLLLAVAQTLHPNYVAENCFSAVDGVKRRKKAAKIKRKLKK